MYFYSNQPSAKIMKKFLIMLPVILLFLSACSKNGDKPLRGLLLTGNDHPAHKWKETTPVIKDILEKDSLCVITVATDPEVLKDVTVKDYDFIVLNYCNWEDPKGLSEYSKAGFLSFLKNGGGLIVLHFSNGAFHKSLPGAEASDWPEYRNVVRRVWDHNGNSTHDPYGEFTVDFPENRHYITREMKPFQTHDELYFNQVGDMSLKPLFTAHSKVSGKEEPLAWVYSYGDARIFQTLLGHDTASYRDPEYREILRRSAKWVTKKN